MDLSPIQWVSSFYPGCKQSWLLANTRAGRRCMDKPHARPPPFASCPLGSSLCSVPPNVTFYVDDIEEPWTFSVKFDFIFSRMLTGSLADWPKFFSRAYEYVFNPTSRPLVLLVVARSLLNH